MKMILAGACGVMGGFVIQAAQDHPDIQIVAGIDAKPRDNTPFPVYATLEDCTQEADILLDFSNASALPGLLEFGLRRNMPLVLCATGHTPQHVEAIAQAAKTIPIFKSANMSLGINLLKRLAVTAARMLGDAYDIEITEKHHHRKLDAPSGTAYLLGDALMEAMPQPYHYVYDRHAQHAARDLHEIGMHAIRGGTVVGEHTIGFYGNDEVIELTHTAQSRAVFAVGALRAVQYLVGKPPGLYNMDDLLAEIVNID